MYSAIASVYDQWMTHIDYAAIHARLLHLLGPDVGEHTVLDVCSGTATTAIQLAFAGAQVIGLDQSAEMIAVAEDKIRGADVSKRVSVKRCNVVGDEPWPEGPFDLIVCLSDSANYFNTDEFRRFTLRASRALTPLGTLLFDVNTPHKLRVVFGNSIYSEELDGYSYIWQSRLSDDHAAIDFNITIFKQKSQSPECWTRHTEHHRQYVHSLESITESLTHVGLQVVSMKPDFSDQQELAPDSLRWVIEARRRVNPRSVA